MQSVKERSAPDSQEPDAEDPERSASRVLPIFLACVFVAVVVLLVVSSQTGNDSPDPTAISPSTTTAADGAPAAGSPAVDNAGSATSAPEPPAPETTTTTTIDRSLLAPPLPPQRQISLGRVLLDAPITASTPVEFDTSDGQVQELIGEQFGAIDHLHEQNWEDIAIVADPDGDFVRTRTDSGTDNQKQWTIPIEQNQETYLVYRFFLEPNFDAGDGSGDQGSPSATTGVKLPGLILGDPGDNTGGNHTAGGFSGRLMIRGTNSEGSTAATRDGITLGAYIYGQEIAGQSITSGFGQDYYFLDGFQTSAFEGINDGIEGGVGDPRIWDLPEGQWITLVLGYRVDGDNGWFKAWTGTESERLQQRLYVPNINWAGGESTAGPDALLFQQFWGGSGEAWYPDSESFTRFKDFAVFTSEADALAAAR